MQKQELLPSDTHKQLPVKGAKTAYPADFEKMWILFLSYRQYKIIGGLGPKKKALAQFKKMKLDPQQLEVLLENIRIQARWKYQTRKRKAAGDQDAFAASFPEVFRYLRDERYDEEVYDPSEEGKKTQPLDSARYQEIVEKHTSRDWAE